MYRLGAVSFLNARPLVEGLDARDDVELLYDVPSRLQARLDGGEVDAALIPVIDLLRSPGRYRVVSDACIGSDGETMTVRVFSQVPPDRVSALAVDTDSHTSVALATVVWGELYQRRLEIRTIDARGAAIEKQDAVLLIGDKVVDPRRAGFAFEVDLGGAWKHLTGLPFVFAVWAQRVGEAAAAQRYHEGLAVLLSEARDAGVARAEEIARQEGPRHGWSEGPAVRYLTKRIRFELDAASVEGADLFGRMCAKYDLAPGDARIEWPESLAVGRVG